MKTTIAVIILLVVSNYIFGQNIAFNYDADGNMESRYIVPLKMAKAAQAEAETTEIPSIELGEQKITIYPNPTQGHISVKIESLDFEKNNFFRLFNASGQIIESRNIESEFTDIDILGISGFYFLDIHLGENTSKWKIIKQ